MKDNNPFTFERKRGIVWVCDLSDSSKFLNSNESVDQIENLIPRLYYISKLLVESFGGKFVKWTGDGFLAWFEIELDRHKQQVAEKVFKAATQLTFICNVTQFGLITNKKIAIRHGVTYEQDALIMTLHDSEKGVSLDIIGRSVVLAFRLSGIASPFPSITSVRDLIRPNNVDFKRWIPTQEQKLKFFKGENFGLHSIVISDKKKTRSKSLQTLIKTGKNVIYEAESNELTNDNDDIIRFVTKMNNGPDWANDVLNKYIDFIKNELLEALKKAIGHLEIIDKEKQK